MTDAEQRPTLNQVNFIARDWDAMLAFYRLLGFDLGAGGEWPPGSGARHAAVATHAGETTVEFDNPPMLRMYADDAEQIPNVLIGLSYPTAAGVDATVARVGAGGHSVRQPAYDAFWGARYAIVQDPDGNVVGLMGPIDRSRAYTPAPRS